ncbi:DUF1697 domain-containing protein [Antribacter gilvus]|uniref:DUF1697 domain-containing protein n=1 Tax=Antribacter gilvus TaxID=2304675 RepID=UPI000F7B78D3|nr:DUF1697 domain-containing protein [Antribacter gilvus]
MPYESVVLYRNMNLGQARSRSPGRAELEAALVSAGARSARSFQSNGTVLLDADDPGGVVEAAAPFLMAASGYDDAAFVRSLDELADAVQGDPFAPFPDDGSERVETVTVFDDGPLPVNLPWTNAATTVNLLAERHGIVVGLAQVTRAGTGSPTVEVERMTAGAATTRTMGTIRRLLAAAERE